MQMLTNYYLTHNWDPVKCCTFWVRVDLTVVMVKGSFHSPLPKSRLHGGPMIGCNLTHSLPAYEYIVPGNQPKIKHISVDLSTT